MQTPKSSWRFAIATTLGMFLFAAGVHAMSRPAEVVDFIVEESPL